MPADGKPDEADVGDALELDDGVEGLALLAEQGEAGGLAAGVGQRGVAEPALAALGEHDAGAGADEVGDDPPVGGADDGAGGHVQDLVLALGAVPVAALAGLAVAGLLVRAVVEVQQRVHARVDLEDDVAAVAAVAPVGAAERLVLLAVHRGHAVAAVAGRDVHGHSIDESGHLRRPLPAKRHERTGQSARALVGGTLCVCSGLDGRDGDGLASPSRAEGDRTGVEREQRVVAAATDAQTRVEVGAALTDDDLAGLDDLAAEALHAEALRVRVATVAGRRGALLVCHVVVSPSRCRGPRRWSGADGAPAACGSRSCS